MLPTSPPTPRPPLTRWQRFVRNRLLSLILFPPAVLIAFWLLRFCCGLDLFWSLLLTPFLTAFVILGEVLAFYLAVILPWLEISNAVGRHRRHPWIRPLYLRCRARNTRHARSA